MLTPKKPKTPPTLESVQWDRAKKKAAKNTKPAVNPENLVIVQNKTARLLVGPQIDMDPARPGASISLRLVPGPNVATLDELDECSENTCWLSWQRDDIDYIEIRQATDQDTLMLQDATKAIEMAYSTADYDQLEVWKRNEWRIDVLDILVQRLETVGKPPPVPIHPLY